MGKCELHSSGSQVPLAGSWEAVMKPAVTKIMGNFLSKKETFSFSMSYSMTLVTGKTKGTKCLMK